MIDLQINMLSTRVKCRPWSQKAPVQAFAPSSPLGHVMKPPELQFSGSQNERLDTLQPFALLTVGLLSLSYAYHVSRTGLSDRPHLFSNDKSLYCFFHQRLPIRESEQLGIRFQIHFCPKAKKPTENECIISH